MTSYRCRITAVTWQLRPTTSRCSIIRKLPRRANAQMTNVEREQMTETLKITNLHVGVEGKPILNGVNMSINRGETHALMGPNGSGKSTLAGVIMGHPNYTVTDGIIELNGEDISDWDATQRARAGIFMAF